MLGQLKQKAEMVSDTFNSMEGITCNAVMGSMYAFPNVRMPEKAVAEAQVRFSYILSHVIM